MLDVVALARVAHSGKLASVIMKYGRYHLAYVLLFRLKRVQTFIDKKSLFYGCLENLSIVVVQITFATNHFMVKTVRKAK